jgi:hypothetical protein
MMGMIDPTMVDVASPPIWESFTSFMQLRMCHVYFGGPASLHYYGYFSDVSVAYTHWSRQMIPIRAAISLSFNAQPIPNWANIAASQAGAAVQTSADTAAAQLAQAKANGAVTQWGQPLSPWGSGSR